MNSGFKGLIAAPLILAGAFVGVYGAHEAMATNAETAAAPQTAAHEEMATNAETAAAPQSAKVDYPAGYRDWTHVKSTILLEKHPLAATFGGLHHIYANDAALTAIKNRTPYPDGAVLVFDLMEVVTDEGETTTSEGPRIRMDVMQKDATKWADIGGWGYESFKGPDHDRIVTDPVAACQGCHASQEGTDFVFSTYRE